MKKILYTLFFLSINLQVFSQLNVKVTSLQGIPFISGMAQEDSSYFISFDLVNTGTITVSDTFDVFIQADALIIDSNAVITTLSDTNTAGFDSIAPGDTISKSNQSFLFSSVNFDSGDNIVVVWPHARMANMDGDKDTTHIFFIPLNNNIDDPENSSIILYPNPSTSYISFKDPGQGKIKQVRILTVDGKLVFQTQNTRDFINIADWKPGLYFIEVEKTDGTRNMIRLQKS
jgi:hypothetical protein